MEVVRPAADGVGRPAVVVVHGYAGSGRLMRPFADTLVRRGYVVALPDLAGHAANTRPLGDIEREIADVVAYLRARPDVDPDRVALLGHSMGATAVVRAGAADPRIPATVAISLPDGEVATTGPRGLLLIAGAWEPGGIRAATRAAGRVEGRRTVTVPMVEHVSVLFAGRTHREAAGWLDDALAHRPDRSDVAATQRVGAGALTLAGALLVLAAGLASINRPRRSGTTTPDRDRLVWLGVTVVAASVAGIVGGPLLAWTMPAPVSGYLVGYFAGAGTVLLAAELVYRRRAGDNVPGLSPRAVATGGALAVVAGAAVIVPVHAGLTAMVPHGPHRWMVGMLVLATAVLLAGAHTAGRPLWAMLVVVLVCVPLPIATVVGLAPGFLVLIAPLVAILFAVYFMVMALAWRAAIPLGHTVAAGALVIAWPVAAALPLA
ncbi:alpha/beta hydrolase [Virgisporangium aurantiacum]|uniref:Alpha/beta hydrolase n=2 Tax=Virgisporangium aurantiacum TaxID=175570 RepID=A0A8J4E1A0_9ACTN|nr:alpha/beta hydrolase [Virgisporangium aurantiacum]